MIKSDKYKEKLFKHCTFSEELLTLQRHHISSFLRRGVQILNAKANQLLLWDAPLIIFLFLIFF